jgi:hypothetical protein
MPDNSQAVPVLVRYGVGMRLGMKFGRSREGHPEQPFKKETGRS